MGMRRREPPVKSALDCIPCLLRQALEALRMATDDPDVHRQVLHDVLSFMADTGLHESPPRLAQQMHRLLREATCVDDPYREAKARHNTIALGLLPEFSKLVATAPDPLDMAIRLAIAGNVIDMGVKQETTESDIRMALEQARQRPLFGDATALRRALVDARDVLYLADNAGEIVFDRLLVEQIGPERVTVVVRGAPVINDATLADASDAGLCDLVPVTDNGSDAPGTLLSYCDEAFRRRFADAGLIIAKGQGNYESLSETDRRVFFLFKVKCALVADDAGMPLGAHVVIDSRRPPDPSRDHKHQEPAGALP